MENIVTIFFTAFLFVISVYSVNYFRISYKNYLYIFTLITAALILLVENYEHYLIPLEFLIIIIFLYREIKSFHACIITCLSIILLFVCNAIVSIVNGLILGISVELVQSSTIIYSLMCTLTGACIIGIGIPFRRFAINHIKKYDFLIKNKVYVYYLLLLVLTVAIFYINIVLMGQNDLAITKIQILLRVFLCIMYSVLLVFIFRFLTKSLRREYEAEAIKNEYRDMKEYTENLENLYNEMRSFRHDYINILSSMNGYIEKDDMKGLKEYFHNNIVKITSELEKRNSQIGVLQNIKIPEIKGLISSKIIKAQEIGIDVNLEIIEEIEKINIDVVHLCRMLGILLDNAIEELERCSNKIMRFALIKKGERVIIVVSNSCREDVAPVFKIFKKGFSTKGEDRGIGLSNLKDMINKYPKVTIETKIINNEFIQCIEI